MRRLSERRSHCSSRRSRNLLAQRAKKILEGRKSVSMRALIYSMVSLAPIRKQSAFGRTATDSAKGKSVISAARHGGVDRPL